MSDSQLVPAKPRLPAVLKREMPFLRTPVVTYDLIDPLHYSFVYRVNDTVSYRMDECGRSAGENDFIEAEFDESVPKKHRTYYALAAASGSLTGVLCFAKLPKGVSEKIEEWKKGDWKELVIYAAELTGCKKKDYKSASKYLVNQAVCRFNAAESGKVCVAHLNTHPTMAGLLFSVITQFSGKACAINEDGEIELSELPKYYFIGETKAEKLVAAVLYWFFALAAGKAESGRHILDDLNIPAELLKLLKKFVKIEFMRRIPENYQEAEKAYSQWIEHIVSIAEGDIESKSEEKQGMIVQLMRMALNFGEEAIPVLINDCIVRCIYVLARFVEVVEETNIHSIEELLSIPVSEFIPDNKRLISGMCLAASASFVGVNISVAALKALAVEKSGKGEFLNVFLTEVNIAGIGRLVFACVADCKYWGDDIKPLFQRRPHAHTGKKTSAHMDKEESAAFSALSLDAVQTRILYCFENIAVQRDIQKTEKQESAKKKLEWLEAWKNSILSGANIPHEYAEKYFVSDEDVLFEGIYELSKDRTNYGWFYLLTQELALFTPYCPLGTEGDSEYKKLKAQYDYVSDQFIRRQTIVSQAELENILKTFKKYTDYVSGKTARTLTAIAAGTAATALTGGVALAYAPGIAAMIAGEAVVGLHGAALTSASLAFVGGGSLAAGGLGMAGGTAIITGGGALIGLAGSGGVSAAAMLMTTNSDYWIRQSAKMLTYAKCVLCDILREQSAVRGLLEVVEQTKMDTTDEIDALRKEENDLDAKYLSKLDEYCNYLGKVKAELEKLNKQLTQ